MARPGFENSLRGVRPTSKSMRFSYAEASAGKQEIPQPCEAKVPGDCSGNSARPRVFNKDAFQQGSNKGGK